jgi:hypothetical protein
LGKGYIYAFYPYTNDTKQRIAGMKLIKPLVFLLVIICVIKAQITADLEYLGGTGAACQSIAVKDNYLFCGGANGINVFDISNPATPAAVNFTRIPNLVYHILIEGNYAYVCAGKTGVVILDITNPAETKIISTSTNRNLVGIVFGKIADGYFYTADEGNIIWRWDISNPQAPVCNGDIQIEKIHWFNIVGQTGYFVTFSGYLVIADISNPSHPVELSRTRSGGNAVMQGNHIYVTSGGMAIFDVSNPSAPVLSSSLSTPGVGYNHSFISNNNIFISDVLGGIRIVDISNPASPAEIGSYTFGNGDSYEIIKNGNYAYLADKLKGLITFDITQISKPNLTHKISIPNICTCVKYSGDTLFIADGYNGVKIYNAGNPYLPKLIAEIPTTGKTFWLELKDKQLYTADTTGMHIYNISDLNNITELGSFKKLDGAWHVSVQRNYAFLSDWYSYMRIIDISNPANPIELSERQDAVTICTYAHGNYAYQMLFTVPSLRIIDITEPAVPVEIHPIPENRMKWVVWDICFSGNYAYAAGGKVQLQIIDISNPESYSLLGNYYQTGYFGDSAGLAFAIDLSGSLACLASDAEGLKIFDVTDPMAPQFLNSFKTGFNAVDVAISDSIIYLAEENGGLSIYKTNVFLPTKESAELSCDNSIKRPIIQNIGNSIRINVPLTVKSSVTFRVFDMKGRIVSRPVTNHNENYCSCVLNKSDYNSGTYVVNIKTRQENISKKITIF